MDQYHFRFLRIPQRVVQHYRQCDFSYEDASKQIDLEGGEGSW